jgi:hypothetical protein
MRRTVAHLVFMFLWTGIAIPVAAGQVAAAALLVGEVRLLAVNPGHEQVARALRRAGWIEADGQVFSRFDLPELFDAIGRTWTADRVPADRFALPDLRRGRAARADDPSGVLGGDLVTGGRALKPAAPAALVYWMYVGRDATFPGRPPEPVPR